MSTVHVSVCQSRNSWRSGALDGLQGPTCYFFPPAEALEKNSDSIKEYYLSGGCSALARQRPRNSDESAETTVVTAKERTLDRVATLSHVSVRQSIG